MRKEYGIMKNNRFSKLLALLLSCLLIISTFGTLAVFADESAEEELPPAEEVVPTPTVSIKYKNIAYEGAVKLVFYVESADLAAGQTVKLALSDAPIDTADLSGATVYLPKGKITVGQGDEAVAYDAFATDEIAPAKLRASVYAVALVVDAEGAIVAESAALEYSVFQYCMDRYALNPTTEQQNLYQALLDFGASVQTVLGYTDETIDEVGGWANAYFGVKVNTVIDDAVIDTNNYYFTADEIGDVKTIGITKFYNSASGVARFSSVTADRGFNVVANPSSIDVTVKGKVGFCSCNLLYTGGGTVSSFVVGKTPTFSGMTFPGTAQAAAPTNDADGNGIPDGRYSIAVSEIVKDAGGNDVENVFVRFVDDNDVNSSPFSWSVSPVAGKTTYILEFDFRWNYANTLRDNSPQVLYYNDIGAMDNNALASFECTSDGTQLKMNGTTMKSGEWHNVQYVYTLNDNGRYDISVYIDGQLGTLADGKTSIEDDEICVRWEPRYGNATGSNNQSFDYANIFFVAY